MLDSSWYGSAGGGGFGPSRVNPNTAPMGMSPHAAPFLNSGGLMGPGGFSSAGAPSQIQQIIQFLGQFLAPGLNLSPTGGSFSPMARGLFEQQQRSLGSAATMFQESERIRMAAPINSLARSMTGVNNIDLSGAVDMIGKVVHGPAGNMLAQVAPGLSHAIKDITGGSSAAGLQSLYGATRAQAFMAGDTNFSARNLGDIMNTINNRFSDERGVRDLSFTQGLNVEDIAGGAAAYMRNFSAGADRLNKGNVEQFLQEANEVTASLRDIFGPGGSVEDLYNNLQQLTQGGLGQVSPQKMTEFLNKMKMTSLATGMPIEAMGALVAQGSMASLQMGAPGMVGANAVMESSLWASRALTERRQGGVWGQASSNQLANNVTQSVLGTVSSREGVALMGLRRAQSMGVDLSPRLAGLVERGLSGSLTHEDRLALSNSGELAQELANTTGISLQGANAFMTDLFNNSEFQDEMQAGLNALTAQAIENRLTGVISTYADTANVDAGALLGAYLDNTDPEKRREALSQLIGDNTNDGSRTTGLMAHIASTLSTEGEQAIDVLRTFRSGGLADARDKRRRMSEMEQRLTRAGVGRGGGAISRLMQAMIGDPDLSTADLLSLATGAPNGEVSNLLKAALAETDSEFEYEPLLLASEGKIGEIQALIKRSGDESLTEEERVQAAQDARKKQLALTEDVDFQMTRALTALAQMDVDKPKDKKKRDELMSELLASYTEVMSDDSKGAEDLATKGIPGYDENEPLVTAALRITELLDKLLSGTTDPLPVRIVQDETENDEVDDG